MIWTRGVRCGVEGHAELSVAGRGANTGRPIRIAVAPPDIAIPACQGRSHANREWVTGLSQASRHLEGTAHTGVKRSPLKNGPSLAGIKPGRRASLVEITEE